MRSISGARNRLVLIIVGILALAAAAWLLIPYFGLDAQIPRAEQIFAEDGATPATIAAAQRLWILPAAVAAAIIAVTVGIALLVAQVPTQTPTSRLRLTGSDGTLLATVDPDVLGRALGEHVEQVPGILDADVRVSGAASAVWLQTSITVAEDAEAAWSINRARQTLAGDIENALGRPARQVDVLVHLRSKGSGSRAVAQPVASRRDSIERTPQPAVQGTA